MFYGPFPGCLRHALRCHGHSCSRQWLCGRAGVLGRGEPCSAFCFCFLCKGSMTTSCALTGRGSVSWDRMGQIRPNFIYYTRHSVGCGHVLGRWASLRPHKTRPTCLYASTACVSSHPGQAASRPTDNACLYAVGVGVLCHVVMCFTVLSQPPYQFFMRVGGGPAQ